MRAKFHLLVGTLVFIALAFPLYIFYLNYVPEKIDSLAFVAGIFLYFVGLILPDSDSNNAGSRIFHTKYFIFGYFTWLLEYPVSKILGRLLGHRQSLHTIIGITITSLIIAVLISFAINFFGAGFSFLSVIFLFAFLFLGQLVHLLCDFHLRII